MYDVRLKLSMFSNRVKGFNPNVYGLEKIEIQMAK